LGPEYIKLNVSNQKGLRSFGFDRGRYIIGAGIDNHSEHLVRHFHQLYYAAITA
jgi:choline monooxygenase